MHTVQGDVQFRAADASGLVGVVGIHRRPALHGTAVTGDYLVAQQEAGRTQEAGRLLLLFLGVFGRG